MDYTVDGNIILVKNAINFDPQSTLDCGQTFRYSQDKNIFKLFAKNSFCILKKEKDCVIIETNSGNVGNCIDYFDLDNDYNIIQSAILVRTQHLKQDAIPKALQYGQGIRILKQDPLEMIISFIISANNNIPRIKGIIERLCIALGEDMGGYRAFPTLDALSAVGEDFYKSIGCGYRAAYLAETTKLLKSFDYNSIKELDVDAAKRQLCLLKGVGAKVADCILLFGYNKTRVFPVDVWTERVCDNLMPELKDNNREFKAKELVSLFGDYSGYAQQYLFYYFRETHSIGG